MAEVIKRSSEVRRSLFRISECGMRILEVRSQELKARIQEFAAYGVRLTAYHLRRERFERFMTHHLWHINLIFGI
jgi:hypothetical protein